MDATIIALSKKVIRESLMEFIKVSVAAYAATEFWTQMRSVMMAMDSAMMDEVTNVLFKRDMLVRLGVWVTWSSGLDRYGYDWSFFIWDFRYMNFVGMK
jgi:hypothetical protein